MAYRSARLGSLAVLACWLLVLAAQPVVHAQTSDQYPQTIVFMTDFGVVDDSVNICKGVMYEIMPTVRIVDLTHQVTPFSILDGARFLYGVAPYKNRAPSRIEKGVTWCVRSTIRTVGITPYITPRHSATESSTTPKSVMNTIVGGYFASDSL